MMNPIATHAVMQARQDDVVRAVNKQRKVREAKKAYANRSSSVSRLTGQLIDLLSPREGRIAEGSESLGWAE